MNAEPLKIPIMLDLKFLDFLVSCLEDKDLVEVSFGGMFQGVREKWLQ
jgi:hypothetical protein